MVESRKHLLLNLLKDTFDSLNRYNSNMPHVKHQIREKLLYMISNKIVEFFYFFGTQNYDKSTYHSFWFQAGIYHSLAFRKVLICTYHSCNSSKTNACMQLTPSVKVAFRTVV